MKILLNIIIFTLIILIWSDIERNSTERTLEYSRTIYCLSGLFVTGFFRINLNNFLQLINRKQ